MVLGFIFKLYNLILLNVFYGFFLVRGGGAAKNVCSVAALGPNPALIGAVRHGTRIIPQASDTRARFVVKIITIITPRGVRVYAYARSTLLDFVIFSFHALKPTFSSAS